MKKKTSVSLILSTLGLLFGVVSCKKTDSDPTGDWKCECTVDGSIDSITYPNTKKSSATKSCNAYETLLKAYYSGVSCKIK